MCCRRKIDFKSSLKQPFEELSPKGFRTVIDIDLVGTYNLSSAGLQYLKKSKNPLIVNITATLQYKATPFQIHASAAKAGK